MTFNEINITTTDARYIGWNDCVQEYTRLTNENEAVTTAVLLGAEFAVSSEYSRNDTWYTAFFEGRRIPFAERFSIHRSAVAFLLCVGFFKGK